MKIIEYANKNPTKGCRFIGEHFSIGKTCIANILKNAETLEKEYEFFKGNYKKLKHGQYHVINEILITWYGRCANIYFVWSNVKGRSDVDKSKIEQK